MKKRVCLSCLLVFLFAGCLAKTDVDPAKQVAANTAVTTLMNEYLNAYNSKEIAFYQNTITDSALILGTDPNEFWTKEKAISEMAKVFKENAALKMVFDTLVIRVSADGNSAFVIDQVVGEKVAFREMLHVVKVNDKWMFDLINWTFVPKNEDMPKINKAL